MRGRPGRPARSFAASRRRVCGAVVTIVPASRRPKAQADGTLAGTAEDLADALDEYRQAGVEEFIIRDDAKIPAAAANDFLLQSQQAVVRLVR
jgi:hypothetical protein